MTINPINSAEYRYDSVNNRVYKVNGNLPGQDIGSVSVIDASTLEVIDTVPVDNPYSIACDSK